MAYLNLTSLRFVLSFSFLTDSFVSFKSCVKPFSRLHKVNLSCYSYISSNCQLSFTSIASYVSIGPRVSTIHGIHPFNATSQSPLFHQPSSSLFRENIHSQIFQDPNLNRGICASRATTIVEEDVWIGADVKIMSGVRIGRGSVIGACTLINKDVPPYSIAYGIPMRVVRQRFCLEQISALEQSRWWTLPPSLAKDLLLEIYENHN